MKRTREALKGGVVKLVASRDYRAWINDLRKRYRAAQTKAAVSVNSALLEFYWNLGKDISEKYAATQYYGSRFFECVSKDLTDSIQNPQGLSVVNIRYCQRFYDLYSDLPNLQQVVEELVSIPWGVAQYKLHKVPPKELSVAAESIARLSVVVDETYAQTKEKGHEDGAPHGARGERRGGAEGLRLADRPLRAGDRLAAF